MFLIKKIIIKFLIAFFLLISTKAFSEDSNIFKECIDLTKFNPSYDLSIKDEDILKGKSVCEEANKINPNNPDINFGLGRIYFEEKNYDKSYNFYKKAMSKGHLYSYSALINFHWFGYGSIPVNRKRAFELALECSNLGNASCIFDLGYFYLEGFVVEEDWTKGIELYKKAASMGSSDANLTLGDIYYFGDYGIESDIDKSKEYFQEEYNKNNPLGKSQLASLYIYEPNSKADIILGLKLMEEAALKNDAYALFELAGLNFFPVKFETLKDNGYEFIPDKQKGLKYFEILLEHINFDLYVNDLLNHSEIAEILDYKDLLPILKKLDLVAHNPKLYSMTTSNKVAYDLAEFYNNNPFIVSNLNKKIEYMSLAAERDDFDSALELARIYYELPTYFNIKLAEKYSRISINNDEMYFKGIAYNRLGKILSFSNNLDKQKEAVNSYLQAIELFDGKGYSNDAPFHNIIEVYYIGQNGFKKNINLVKKFLDKSKENDFELPLWSFLVDTFEDNLPENQNQLEQQLLYAALNGFSDAFHVLAYSYNGFKEDLTFNENLGLSYKWFYVCSVICSNEDLIYEAQNNLIIIEKFVPGMKIVNYEYDARDWINKIWSDKDNEINRIELALNINNSEQSKNYALLIGNNDYKNLSSLENPINDIDRIGGILKNKYNYKLKSLTNASRGEITKSLNNHVKFLKENDNFILYYSGHGDQDTDEGFWLPVDADYDDDTNWIANSYITRKLRQIKAKNILVIADSCYSGTLTRGLVLENTDLSSNDELLQLYKNNKTRVVISSGGEKPVLDGGGNGHSVFARSLINELESRSESFTATNLFTNFNERVSKNSKALGLTQIPRFADIPNSGHENMDFVFNPVN